MTEEELKSVPSITLDQEDIAHRQSYRGSAYRSPVEDVVTEVVPDTESSASSSRGVLMGFALVLTATLGGLAWLGYSLQETQTQLAQATQRVELLEQRLASTDTTITQSEVLLADKLKSMDQLIDSNKTEVRELWGLAGDVQRKAIEQLKVVNDQQNASLKAQQGAQAAADQKLLEHQGALEQLAVTSKNSESSAREAVQRMELTQEKVSSLSAETQTLKQKQAQQEGDYSKRITALEDTAKSTDVFRRNTQEELRKLRDELQRQSAPAPKSSL